MLVRFKINETRQIQMRDKLSNDIFFRATGVLYRDTGEIIHNTNINFILQEANGENSDIATILLSYIYGVKEASPTTGVYPPDTLILTLDETNPGSPPRPVIVAVEVINTTGNNNIHTTPNWV